MRIIFILVMLISFSSCTQEPTQSSTSPLPEVDSLKNAVKQVLISSSHSALARPIVYQHSHFDLVINTAKDTAYLATEDTTFKTQEGYKVGMALSQVLPKDAEKMYTEPGWGYYITTASGWQLGFCEGSSCTDSLPKNDSRVKWIFKRK